MVGCGLVALHLKSTLVDKVFTATRNWLALGGEGQSFQAPRCQSIRIQEIKDIVNRTSRCNIVLFFLF